MNTFIICVYLIMLLSPVQFSELNTHVALNNSGSDRLKSNTLCRCFISNFNEKRLVAGLISSSFLKDSSNEMLYLTKKSGYSIHLFKIYLKENEIKLNHFNMTSSTGNRRNLQKQNTDSMVKKNRKIERNNMPSGDYLRGITLDVGK